MPSARARNSDSYPLKSSHEVLCVDIGSGGISAARFDEDLTLRGYDEIPWGNHIRSPETLKGFFHQLLQTFEYDAPPAAICIASFMHSFILRYGPLITSRRIETWMGYSPPEGTEAIRRCIGSEFHKRTGCHYHPMFPVFKLASMNIAPWHEVLSPKAFLVEALTGSFVDDYGMASATGLLNIQSSTWDEEILRAAQLRHESLPRLAEPQAVVGKDSKGSPVINGSGDGFMANIGSGCEHSRRIAITLGTSAAVRQMVNVPVLDPAAGTFCYRANSQNAFLLGCASSNGGNALDWARREFNVSEPELQRGRNIPIFLPWLNGERSLEWNPDLKPSWHGREPGHTGKELFRAVMEGVVFNLAQYVEVIENASGIQADQFVLSGNGFLDPAVAPMLTALVSRETLQPEEAGLGTLRGAAITAWRALGHDASPAVERMLLRAKRVTPLDDDGLQERFLRFKQLRAHCRGGL